MTQQIPVPEDDAASSQETITTPRRKYWYRDLASRGKRHWTRARFVGWTPPTGLLHVPYAIFARPSGELLYIPRYLLTNETQTLLPDPNASDEPKTTPEEHPDSEKSEEPFAAPSVDTLQRD